MYKLKGLLLTIPEINDIQTMIADKKIAAVIANKYKVNYHSWIKTPARLTKELERRAKLLAEETAVNNTPIINNTPINNDTLITNTSQ
jgi:hypothetical protein